MLERNTTNKMPLVSIIIPVFNVENYLRECLTSVAKQTLTDIEIICINDVTPDNSVEILLEFQKNDDRFIIIHHDENKGLAGARNTGLSIARGEYIYFLDSDDRLACDDAIETLYERARKYDSDEVVGGILKWDDITGETHYDWHINYLEKDVYGEPLSCLPQLWANVVASNKLIRRTFLVKNNINFNEALRKHEDNPFSAKVHILSKKISIVTKTTYLYRQSNINSIMSNVRKTDVGYRCLLVGDIFKFIESSRSFYKYRSFYYPIYTRNLIATAELLDRFFPTQEEIYDLMADWRKIFSIIPYDDSHFNEKGKEIYLRLSRKQMMGAWSLAVPFSKENFARIERQRTRMQNLNTTLSKQKTLIENSTSWRVTALFRNMVSNVCQGR